MAEKPDPSYDPAQDPQPESTTTAQNDEHVTTSHHLNVPPGLTPQEFNSLKPYIAEFHTYKVDKNKQCSSLLAQKIHAPRATVWAIVRRFDKPQVYKHFIKSCTVREGFTLSVGCTRDVNVISGLPAATSTERLDILDDTLCVTGFSILGGEHRLRNYRSVTSLHALDGDAGEETTIVLESYVVDVPEGNTQEDTRLFADTVIKLNLQKLGSVAVATMARDGGSGGGASGGGENHVTVSGSQLNEKAGESESET